MDIREHFAFCPRCGAPAHASDNHRRFTCGNCRFMLYFNVGASVSGLCRRDDGYILLLKRMHMPRQGTWTLPGGFVEPGESGVQALLREVFEETGLTVENPVPQSAFPNTYTYQEVTYSTFDLVYLCELRGVLKLDGIEVDGFKWFSPDELRTADISFPSLKLAVDLYLLNLR